jgi:hypothetical protein
MRTEFEALDVSKSAHAPEGMSSDYSHERRVSTPSRLILVVGLVALEALWARSKSVSLTATRGPPGNASRGLWARWSAI